MTDKEFKRLSREQLIDVIYQLQLQIDKLTEENQSLEAALADKRLRISNAGSLAEAALAINDVFLSAQKAADQYLDEIRLIREETEAERQRIRKEALVEAGSIVDQAKKNRGDYDSAVEAILEEYRQSRSDNG